MKRLLIGWDGAEAGHGAVSLGGRLARAFKAEVTLMGISEDPERQPELLEALSRAQRQLREEQQVRSSILAAEGSPVERIANATEETSYGLLVIGGARPGGQAETALKLIKKVHSRILVAQQDTTRLERILLCSGGSRHSEKAVRFAGELARRMNAELTFFHVLPKPPTVFAGMIDEVPPTSALGRLLERQNQLLNAAGVRHTVKLRYGFVLDQLRQELDEGNYDLVVVGARQKGSGGYFLDNLTREILLNVSCSVLVMRTMLQPSRSWLQRLRRWIKRR